jgi:cell fate (sporulation/competence/biofilm development) regulator YmcA (YheA/YmcA/DUF963 family)
MKSVDELIAYLKEDDTIKAYKQLEQKIQSSEKYQAMYNDLLDKQKAMVNAEVKYKKLYPAKKRIYLDALDKIQNEPIIHQYLMMQDEVNEKIQTITSTIEAAINKPFMK